MYGCYRQIEGGHPEEALHDLTGAPIKMLRLNSKKFNKEAEWAYLLKASRLEYSMVAGSKLDEDQSFSCSNIDPKHAYTFLNATYLNHKNERIRLVQLRNPWG